MQNRNERDQVTQRGVPFRIAVALLFLMAFSLTFVPATADVIIVNESSGSTGVQNMINRTSSGDSLFLSGGTYKGSIVIDRPIIFGALDSNDPPVILADTGNPGITLDVDGITLTGVVIRGSAPVGLLVRSNNNRVSTMTVSGFRTGIELQSATSNIFSENTLSNNSVGIASTKSSRSNIFYLNRFDNREDITGIGAENIWFSGNQDYQYGGKDVSGPLGNSWSAYSGTDSNGDGIGDTSYVLRGPVAEGSTGITGPEASDRAPLVASPSAYTLVRSGNASAVSLITRSGGNHPLSAPDSGLSQYPYGGNPGAGQQPGTNLPPEVTGTTGAPPPGMIPGILLQYWWVIPILILVAAAGGIWYERSRKQHSVQPAPDPLQTLPSRNATIVTLPAGGPSGNNQESPYFTVRLPPLLEKKYPDAEYMGEGGVGRVFKAWDAVQNRPVAIKIPVRFDEVTGVQFTRELHIWQGLHDRNIVEVYAANVFPMPYIEMEYIETSLAARQFPLELAEALRIIRGIAHGLRYAHERGIVHRDIKPENVLMAPDGTPKITDWGLAKALADTRHTGLISFSLNYAAPEQLAPNVYGDAGQWTDIYQLGVLFYQMVTGHLPFGGSGMGEVTHAILHTDPLPAELPGSYGPALGAVIGRCLKKKPADRYEGITAFLADLDCISTSDE